MGATATNAEIERVTELVEISTIDDLNSRHRRERKDMQAKIQELKKNAPKSDKKKRKEATEVIARLESELEERHAAELKTAKQPNETTNCKLSATPKEARDPTSATEERNELEDNNSQQQQRISKAQKRRDKKEREVRQRNDEIRAAANSDDLQFAPKVVEARNLQAILKERNLTLYQVPSDGDCLYNAVRHQMIQKNLGEFSIYELRSDTADYIHANKETLIYYMTHPRTGELLTDAEFEKYCKAVRLTPAWGGEIELKALSSVLKVPIEVLQAEGPPTIHGTDEFFGPRLVITYHRHMYSLGEHYNSTVPYSEASKQLQGDLSSSKE